MKPTKREIAEAIAKQAAEDRQRRLLELQKQDEIRQYRDKVWIYGMATELMMMGLPFTHTSIEKLLTEALEWAESHPSPQESYDRVNRAIIKKPEVSTEVSFRML